MNLSTSEELGYSIVEELDEIQNKDMYKHIQISVTNIQEKREVFFIDIIFHEDSVLDTTVDSDDKQPAIYTATQVSPSPNYSPDSTSVDITTIVTQIADKLTEDRQSEFIVPTNVC